MPKKHLTEKQLVDLIDKAIKDYSGDSSVLASAIGMLMIGRKMGWKVIYLTHNKGTIKKYEKILGVDDIREILDDEGPLANKSIAYLAVKKVTNFWKAVKGEIPDVRSTELN